MNLSLVGRKFRGGRRTCAVAACGPIQRSPDASRFEEGSVNIGRFRNGEGHRVEICRNESANGGGE
jgi:hypothetical protein